MKSILSTLLVLLSVNTLAISHQEVCDLVAGQDNSLKAIYGKDLIKGERFNQWEKRMFMTYEEGEFPTYSEATLNKKFKKFLAYEGDGYSEFEITLYRDIKTKQKVVLVDGYPGDNHAGYYLTTSGEIIAEIHDGDIYAQGDYCGSEE